MVREEAHELWKSNDEHSVHRKLLINHESVERPKRFFFAQIHQQHTGDRRHSLAVTELAVVAAVSREDIEKLLLFSAVTLAKIVVIAKTPENCVISFTEQ